MHACRLRVYKADVVRCTLSTCDVMGSDQCHAREEREKREHGVETGSRWNDGHDSWYHRGRQVVYARYDAGRGGGGERTSTLGNLHTCGNACGSGLCRLGW